MRIQVVTSQFPIAGEPNRGRPILQTVRALADDAQRREAAAVAAATGDVLTIDALVSLGFDMGTVLDEYGQVRHTPR